MFLDVLSLLISKAAFIGLRLLVLLLFSLVLEKEHFGAMSVAFLTADISRFVADWGVDTWSLRQFSNPDSDIARNQFYRVLRLRIFSSALAVLITYSAIGLMGIQLTALEALTVSSLAATSLWINLGVNWLQARQLLRNYAIVLLIGALLCVVSLYLVYVVKGAPVNFIAALLVFELCVAAFMMYRILSVEASGDDFNVSEVLLILRDTTPIALAIFMALAYGRADIFYVSSYFGSQMLADYSFASRAVDPILLFSVAISSTLYARASMMYQEAESDKRKFRDYAYGKIRFVSLSAFVVCGLFVFLGPKLVDAFLPKYSTASGILVALLLATAFRCVNLGLTAIIQATGGYKTMTKISVFNACTTISLIFVGGFLFQAQGVAVAVATAEAINSFLQFSTLNRITRIEV